MLCVRKKPTPAELEILDILWRRGPVSRDESERAHVYRPRPPT